MDSSASGVVPFQSDAHSVATISLNLIRRQARLAGQPDAKLRLNPFCNLRAPAPSSSISPVHN